MIFWCFKILPGNSMFFTLNFYFLHWKWKNSRHHRMESLFPLLKFTSHATVQTSIFPYSSFFIFDIIIFQQKIDKILHLTSSWFHLLKPLRKKIKVFPYNVRWYKRNKNEINFVKIQVRLWYPEFWLISFINLMLK